MRQDMKANGNAYWDIDTARRHGSDALSLARAAISEDFGEFGLFTSTVDNFLAPPGDDESSDGVTSTLRKLFAKATMSGKGKRKLLTLDHLAAFLAPKLSEEVDESKDERQTPGTSSPLRALPDTNESLPWQLDWTKRESTPAEIAVIEHTVKVEDSNNGEATVQAHFFDPSKPGSSASPRPVTPSNSQFHSVLTPTDNFTFANSALATPKASPVRRTRSENSPSHLFSSQSSRISEIMKQPSFDSVFEAKMVDSMSNPDLSGVFTLDGNLSASNLTGSPRPRKRLRITEVNLSMPQTTSLQHLPPLSPIVRSTTSSTTHQVSSSGKHQKLRSLLKRCDRAKQSSQTPNSLTLTIQKPISSPSFSPEKLRRE